VDECHTSHAGDATDDDGLSSNTAGGRRRMRPAASAVAAQSGDASAIDTRLPGNGELALAVAHAGECLRQCRGVVLARCARSKPWPCLTNSETAEKPRPCPRNAARHRIYVDRVDHRSRRSSTTVRPYRAPMPWLRLIDPGRYRGYNDVEPSLCVTPPLERCSVKENGGGLGTAACLRIGICG